MRFECTILYASIIYDAQHIQHFNKRGLSRWWRALSPPVGNSMNDVQDIQRRLVELDVEHRDLDAVIALLSQEGHPDQLQLRRLKKRKLQLKDHITLLKMQLVPDVPA